jgi:carboxypeptidase Q
MKSMSKRLPLTVKPSGGADVHQVTKRSLADEPEWSGARLARWPYLDAAGFYAPQFMAELPHFTSLEPLALHYLDTGKPIKAETVGENLRITFQVEDELANVQKTALAPSPNDLQATTTSKERVARVGEVSKPNILKPTRTVALLLDPKHGYGIAERDEWNAAGQRIGHLESQDWKFYGGPGLWLPNRCFASYYVRPRLFITEFSEHPIHFVTNELRLVEFGGKDVPLHFDQQPSGSRIFDPTASTVPASTGLPPALREGVDIGTVEGIKTEVLRHSQVMDLVSWLTDVYGPRLTGSPNTQAAADWVVATLRSWGLINAHLEPWGLCARAGTSEQFAFRAVAPRPFMINAVPSVGSPSTLGRLMGPAIRFDVHSFTDMQRYAGKLHGAFLLLDPPQPTPAHFRPEATRLSDARLAVLAAAEPLPRSASNDVVELRYTDRLMEDPAARRWLLNEGVAAVLFTASGDGGTIFLSGNGGTSGSLDKNDSGQFPSVKVSAESYGRIARILEKNIPMTLELEMRNTFYDHPNVFNVIAEIPGTDPKLKDEVVMMGAHLDSWTLGTGATDNAAGSAMLMEAMRILKVLNLQPRRTIRIALWTGEEQGALGSLAYVAEHYRNAKENAPAAKPEYDNFSVYFNLDGGGGKIRGVFAPGNTASVRILEAWMRPFNDLGMMTLSPWDIGGGDDLSFKRVGLPSFGFIQDPIEYTSRTHHSTADVYERLQPEDMQFNTAVLANFAWQAAQRLDKFPR